MSDEVELTRTSGRMTHQVERAENVQVLVAIAILSGYISLPESPDALFNSFSFALNVLAFVSLLFLGGKLITLTVRPVYSHQLLKKLDRKILPGFFVFIFLMAFGVILPSVIPISGQNIASFAQELSMGFPWGFDASDTYILIWALASIPFGYLYVSKTANKMSDLETVAPDVRLSFTSGSRGETFSFDLKNPHDEKIPPEDIRIELNPSPGVDVDIPDAKHLEERIWRPRLAVPANSRLGISVQITRSDESSEISDEHVEIITKYQGQTKRKQTVDLEG